MVLDFVAKSEIVDDPWWFLNEFWRILISFPGFPSIYGISVVSLEPLFTGAVLPAGVRFPCVLRGFLREAKVRLK